MMIINDDNNNNNYNNSNNSNNKNILSKLSGCFWHSWLKHFFFSLVGKKVTSQDEKGYIGLWEFQMFFRLMLALICAI